MEELSRWWGGLSFGETLLISTVGAGALMWAIYRALQRAIDRRYRMSDPLAQVAAMRYYDPSRDEALRVAKAVGGFVDPEAFLEHLRNSRREIEHNGKTKMRASEIAYMAREIKGEIIRAQDGSAYYVIGQSTMLSYFRHVDELDDIVELLKKLNELEERLFPQFTADGKVIVDASRLLFRARTGAMRKVMDASFFEVALLQIEPVAISREIALKVIADEEYQRRRSEVDRDEEKRVRDLESIVSHTTDDLGRRVLRLNDGGYCVLEHDGCEREFDANGFMRKETSAGGVVRVFEAESVREGVDQAEQVKLLQKMLADALGQSAQTNQALVAAIGSLLAAVKSGPSVRAVEIIQTLRKTFMPQMRSAQEAVLRRLIADLYASKGIIADNPATWDAELPTLHELFALLTRLTGGGAVRVLPEGGSSLLGALELVSRKVVGDQRRHPLYRSSR